MKKSCILILILILLPLINAGSIGISPAYFKEYFTPNLKQTFGFHTFNSNSNEEIAIYLSGELAKYATLDKERVMGNGHFKVMLNLPEKLGKPGKHRLLVGVTEYKNITGGNVGGIAAIRAPIEIFVPYPGQYAEATFSINNINQGEKTRYEIEVINLGTQKINVKPKIEIYKGNRTEKILTKEIKGVTLQSKNKLNIWNFLDTENLSAGDYNAMVTIDYGKVEEITKKFRVGEFLVEVTDYDYLFEKGRINQFNIEIKNKWNTEINQIFARISITDNGKVVGNFQTVSVSTKPWETKNITGYFDATELETKRYIANIMLSYGNESSSKLVAIYIQEPPKGANYLIYIVLGGIILIVIIVYLLMKIKQIKKQNEK